VRRLNSYSLVQLGLGKNLRRVQAAMSDYTSAIAVEIAQDKDDTRRVLGNIGLPVPQGGIASSVERAVELAEEIGFPLILKPLDASHGRGISGRLDDVEGLRRAWEANKDMGRKMVIERFVTGNDHRVLVVDGKVAAVAERVPAHVVGDGTHTVRELIRTANQDPRRGRGHTRTLTHLPDDRLTDAYLAKTGFSTEYVPAEGERVFLRATANLSTGGTSVDRTDEMHPDNVTACEMAAGIVGLDIAGIDVLSPDISVPFRENGAVIIEVNAAPGLRMHSHPSEGTPRNVGRAHHRHAVPAGLAVHHPRDRHHRHEREDDHHAPHRAPLPPDGEDGRLHDHGRRVPAEPAGDGGGHDGPLLGQHHPQQPHRGGGGAGDGARRAAARGAGLRRGGRGRRPQRLGRTTWGCAASTRWSSWPR
jgi:cyanophycin synthetase